MRVRVLVIVAAIATAAQGGTVHTQSPKGLRLSDLNWQQAADLLRPDTVVVLPLASGSTEHGAHLKLGTDAAIADYLARRVMEAADVVVAPPLDYHYTPPFLDHAGSASLTPETARALTVDVAAALARYGPRRFYVLNTSAVNPRALAAAALTLAQQGILLTYTDLPGQMQLASARVRQEPGSPHAGEIETSLMLFVDPASVDMRRAVKEFRASASRDATLATADKGRVVMDALVASVLADVEALRRMPVPLPSASSSVPAGPADVSQPRGPVGPRGCTTGDERTIRQIGDAFTLHWSNADAEKLAALWSREGDIFHPDGSIERGREVIRANRAALFIRPEYRGSKHPLTVTMIRCLNAEVAVADGKWELRGLADDKGKALPTFEGQFTIVAKRGDDGWLIEAYRYTQKPAAAPMPTLLKRPGFPGGE